MNKQNGFKVLILAMGLLSLPGLAQAEFVKGMSQQQMVIETSAQLNAGASLEMIAKQANAAGLNPAKLVEVLIQAGQDPIAVVSIMIGMNPSAAESIAAAAVAASPGQAGEITNAAIVAAPAQSKSIVLAVLTVPGVNPGDVLSASASGRSSGARDRGREEHKSERNKDNHHHVTHETPHSGGGGSASPS